MLRNSYTTENLKSNFAPLYFPNVENTKLPINRYFVLFIESSLFSKYFLKISWEYKDINIEQSGFHKTWTGRHFNSVRADTVLCNYGGPHAILSPTWYDYTKQHCAHHLLETPPTPCTRYFTVIMRTLRGPR